MKLNVYTIFDVKAKIYNRPFFLINHDIATRTALDLVNDPQSDCAKHPEDFVLYQLGTYEDTTGVIELLPLPDMLFRFIDIPNEPLQAEVNTLLGETA